MGQFSPILFALFCPDLIKLEFIESCCPFSHFARSLFYLNYSGITQSGGSVFPNFRTTLRVTWKSPFCNRASRPWRSTSRWGCSCIRSTGRTWRATLCPTRWGGTGPRWAVHTRHSGPSCLRPAGCRVPTFPTGLRFSVWDNRGTTFWLPLMRCQAKTESSSRSKVPAWQSCGESCSPVTAYPATCHNPQPRGEKRRIQPR